MVNTASLDKMIGWTLAILLVLVIMSITLVRSKEGFPLPKTKMVRRDNVPAGWTEAKTSWICSNINGQSIDNLIKALKNSSNNPTNIRIVPPIAEVVWP